MTGSALGPLAGLRVVDCSTVLAGPYCTMLLADLGADVVKVEPPEGDATRSWGPPWVGSEADGTRTAAYYLSVNRNKRSIRLNLRRREGVDILRDLLERADVFVDNFRLGALRRIGLGERALAKLNPGLVHLSISGYGPDGPDAGRPGYDFVLQAEAGLMSITGPADDAGGRPMKVGVAITDLATGLHGTVAVLAAIAGRERNGSPARGQGQRIDVSLLESTLAILTNQAHNAFVTGQAPERRGNAHPNIVPYETFDTSDGEIAVAIGSERQWPRLCEALGLAALAAAPAFARNGGRVEHRVELRAILAERFSTDTTEGWLARLRAADLPVAPINDIPAAFGSAQAQARRMTVEVNHPVLGASTQVGLPFELSLTPATIRSAPPMLGEHADEILGEIGLDPARIKELRRDGTI